MENNRLVVANLKMNMDISDVNEYLKVINPAINSKYVAICPTSIYIPYFLKHNYLVGLQNTYYHDKGAYTGEISPLQASKMGVDLTILGHSERRLHFKETNELINSKINDAIKNNLKVILCIGESLDERQENKTIEVLRVQLSACLNDISLEMLEKVIIAYEPIWAIGTNVIPTNEQIENTIADIKKAVLEMFGYKNISVLYGGSVNVKNIAELNKVSNINGYLIGGAALDPQALLSIIEVVVKQ